MLQLTLIRHAKSSWGDAGLRDFDRPLNARGRDDAPKMGDLIKQHGLVFERMVSSPANRAISTARLIAKQLAYPEATIELLAPLYEASINELLKSVQTFSRETPHVALVAHNPGITGLCNYLCGESIDNLPTCAVAVIEFALDDWQAVYRGNGTLKLLLTPKQHAA